jgi:hypothetical protein
VGAGRPAAEAAPVARDPARPIGLIGLVRGALGLKLLLEAAPGLGQPRLARARDRPRLALAALVEALAGVAQPAAAAWSIALPRGIKAGSSADCSKAVSGGLAACPGSSSRLASASQRRRPSLVRSSSGSSSPRASPNSSSSASSVALASARISRAIRS